MLEHAIGEVWGEVEVNNSIDEDKREEIEDSEDYDALNEHFLNIISSNIDNFVDNFKENKERIIKLSKKEKITEEQKALLNKILKKIN
jgi:hypothetical protein